MTGRYAPGKTISTLDGRHAIILDCSRSESGLIELVIRFQEGSIIESRTHAVYWPGHATIWDTRLQ